MALSLSLPSSSRLRDCIVRQVEATAVGHTAAFGLSNELHKAPDRRGGSDWARDASDVRLVFVPAVCLSKCVRV